MTEQNSSANTSAKTASAKAAMTAAAKATVAKAAAGAKKTTTKAAAEKTTAAKSTAAKSTTAAKTTAAKSTAAKTTAAKTTTAKTTAAKTTAAKTTAAKTTAAKSTAAKSTTTKAASAKTTAAKTTAAKTTAAKSTTAKTTAAKSTAAKTTAAKSTSTRSTAAKKTTAAKTTAAKSTTTTKRTTTRKTTAKAAAAKAAEPVVQPRSKAKAAVIKAAQERAKARKQRQQAKAVAAPVAPLADEVVEAVAVPEVTEVVEAVAPEAQVSEVVEAVETPEVAEVAEVVDDAPEAVEAVAEVVDEAPEAVIVDVETETPVADGSVDGEASEVEETDVVLVDEPGLEVIEEIVPDFSNLPPVLIAAAEAAPLAKTGGLADVVGALPKYLKRLGVDARLILPFHRDIKNRYRYETQHLFNYNASGVWPSRFVGIEKLEVDGVICYLVDNEYYFGGDIYSGDNFEGDQYGFFVQAVVDALPNLDFHPRIVHCNDWHTALLPLKLRARAHRDGYWPPATLLTIHNLAFQGWWGKELEAKMIGADERAIAWDLGVWNMLKAGIDVADRVNTVSPTYANEICTPEFGEGLQGDLASKRDGGRLSGILNGIDLDVWNPATDPVLPANFSLSDLSGKAECKRAIMGELGLDDDVDAPLIGLVSRLTPQKGIELMPPIIDACVDMGAKFVILGNGYPELEWQLRECENRHRGRVCSYIGYNNDLAHRIYAACDFYIMPSAFEPCGISQMIAMRYGALPIVHEVGGLKDTVQPYNQYTGEGDGFSFSRFDFWDALEAVKRAMATYGDKDVMATLINNAMSRNFGFERCARSYAELYESMGIW